MKTTGKTVLVTGGGSGIGFQIAKAFSEKGNKVIITGRDEKKLKEAAGQLSNVDFVAADVTNEADVRRLVAFVTEGYPTLDILVNNAGSVSVYNLGPDAGGYKKAAAEVATNYLAVVELTEQLLPVLAEQDEAAVVNVTSILALTPLIHMPTHSASKAAARAYTQILRFTLEHAGSSVKVFEVIPPLVNTEFSKAIGGATHGMPPEEVAKAVLEGLENNTSTILVGGAAMFYQGFHACTEDAVAALHQRAEKS